MAGTKFAKLRLIFTQLSTVAATLLVGEKMAAAAAAALLDELMGRNRNAAPNEKAQELNWEDSEVRTIFF